MCTSAKAAKHGDINPQPFCSAKSMLGPNYFSHHDFFLHFLSKYTNLIEIHAWFLFNLGKSDLTHAYSASQTSQHFRKLSLKSHHFENIFILKMLQRVHHCPNAKRKGGECVIASHHRINVMTVMMDGRWHRGSVSLIYICTHKH